MTSLEETPDIIIVGGGAAGLVLANELSTLSKLRVYVFEAGDDCTGHPDLQNLATYTANLGTERDWQYDTIPQAGFNGRTAPQNAGKLFGGSAAINGGYYVAPSRAGVTAWKGLGNEAWSFERVRAACLEIVQIHGPPKQTCDQLGLTEIEAATQPASQDYTKGRIQVSAEVNTHPVTQTYFRAVRRLGYPTSDAVFGDQSARAQPVYFTHNPETRIRSDASSVFGASLKKNPRVKLFVNTTVTRVILEGNKTAGSIATARGVEVERADGNKQTFHAAREVILAAGALGTPKILELSGVGDPALLQRHGIPLVVANPSVGTRLRNHVMALVHVQLSSGPDAPPPVTPGMLAMAYLPSQEASGLVDALVSHTTTPGSDDAYDAQLKSIFLDPQEGSCCHFVGFLGVPNAYTFGIISAVPFSQGSSHIASADAHAPPIVDPAFFSHPLDLEVMSRHLVGAMGLTTQPELSSFFQQNANGQPTLFGATPALTANPTDVDAAREFLQSTALTTYHASGTAAMRPREDGGVVDERLVVYGTRNLRVVDASAIPMLAHGNPMATVYGIAKIAAGLIVADNTGRVAA